MMGSAVARPSPPPTSLLARGPWVALVLTALATWIGGSAALEFNRAQVLDGQWWRIVTGNLVHYGPAHARGDILAFLIWASLIAMLDQEADEEQFADLAHIVFDQASLAEGGQLADPAAYVGRLNRLLLKLSGQ